jgi:hypothetical protein
MTARGFHEPTLTWQKADFSGGPVTLSCSCGYRQTIEGGYKAAQAAQAEHTGRKAAR